MSKISQEERSLTKYYIISHLMLLVILTMIGYQREIASMVYKLFHEKAGQTGKIFSEFKKMSN